MGTPNTGDTPSEGTPVLIMNYKGVHYLVSMIQLVSDSSSSIQSNKVQAAVSDLYTTTSIVSDKIGTQGAVNYHCITSAPYLAIIDNNGKATGAAITAKLYNSSGTELSWDNYLNKYYSGTLITEDSSKTNLSQGIWAFKLTGSLATASEIYNGTPTTRYMAVTKYCNSTDSSSSSGYVYIGVTASVYKKITITSGVLSTVANSNIVVGYNVKWTNSTLSQDSSSTIFLKPSGNSISAKYMTLDGSTVQSSYFTTTSSSATSIEDSYLKSNSEIVGPRLQIKDTLVIS
jgi:hypothetical protein